MGVTKGGGSVRPSLFATPSEGDGETEPSTDRPSSRCVGDATPAVTNAIAIAPPISPAAWLEQAVSAMTTSERGRVPAPWNGRPRPSRVVAAAQPLASRGSADLTLDRIQASDFTYVVPTALLHWLVHRTHAGEASPVPVCLGPSGAGKSTVARLLALETNAPHRSHDVVMAGGDVALYLRVPGQFTDARFLFFLKNDCYVASVLLSLEERRARALTTRKSTSSDRIDARKALSEADNVAAAFSVLRAAGVTLVVLDDADMLFQVSTACTLFGLIPQMHAARQAELRHSVSRRTTAPSGVSGVRGGREEPRGRSDAAAAAASGPFHASQAPPTPPPIAFILFCTTRAQNPAHIVSYANRATAAVPSSSNVNADVSAAPLTPHRYGLIAPPLNWPQRLTIGFFASRFRTRGGGDERGWGQAAGRKLGELVHFWLQGHPGLTYALAAELDLRNAARALNVYPPGPAVAGRSSGSLGTLSGKTGASTVVDVTEVSCFSSQDHDVEDIIDLELCEAVRFVQAWVLVHVMNATTTMTFAPSFIAATEAAAPQAGGEGGGGGKSVQDAAAADLARFFCRTKLPVETKSDAVKRLLQTAQRSGRVPLRFTGAPRHGDQARVSAAAALLHLGVLCIAPRPSGIGFSSSPAAWRPGLLGAFDILPCSKVATSRVITAMVDGSTTAESPEVGGADLIEAFPMSVTSSSLVRHERRTAVTGADDATATAWVAGLSVSSNSSSPQCAFELLVKGLSFLDLKPLAMAATLCIGGAHFLFEDQIAEALRGGIERAYGVTPVMHYSTTRGRGKPDIHFDGRFVIELVLGTSTTVLREHYERPLKMENYRRMNRGRTARGAPCHVNGGGDHRTLQPLLVVLSSDVVLSTRLPAPLPALHEDSDEPTPHGGGATAPRDDAPVTARCATFDALPIAVVTFDTSTEYTVALFDRGQRTENHHQAGAGPVPQQGRSSWLPPRVCLTIRRDGVIKRLSTMATTRGDSGGCVDPAAITAPPVGGAPNLVLTAPSSVAAECQVDALPHLHDDAPRLDGVGRVPVMPRNSGPRDVTGRQHRKALDPSGTRTVPSAAAVDRAIRLATSGRPPGQGLNCKIPPGRGLSSRRTEIANSEKGPSIGGEAAAARPAPGLPKSPEVTRDPPPAAGVSAHEDAPPHMRMCPACGVPVAVTNWDNHVLGRQHRRRTTMATLGENQITAAQRSCPVCNVQVPVVGWEAHVAGRQHQRELGKCGGRAAGVGEEADGTLPSGA